VIGADYYESTEDLAILPRNSPPIGIGERSMIQDAIIDKNCRIGRDVHVANDTNTQQLETPQATICDGIIVCPKNAVLPDGWRLSR
jgi:glucose-1-phosphate adenylyltransferase